MKIEDLDKKIKEILECVSTQTGVSTEAIIGKSREQEVVEARYIALKIMREELGIKMLSLSKVFGKSNHSWAVYANKKIEEMSQIYKQFKQKLEKIKKTYKKQYKMEANTIELRIKEELLEAVLGGLALWYRQNIEIEEIRKKVKEQIDEILEEIFKRGIDREKYNTYRELIK